ncbi:MAG: hypothetical protein ABIJ08_06650 [Nanoarchaeota archaeon]
MIYRAIEIKKITGDNVLDMYHNAVSREDPIERLMLFRDVIFPLEVRLEKTQPHSEERHTLLEMLDKSYGVLCVESFLPDEHRLPVDLPHPWMIYIQRKARIARELETYD